MRLTRALILSVIVFLFPLLLFPQAGKYKMELYGTRDGLLSSKIFALHQGHNRLLWIGTEFGASSFNGYSFTNYQFTGQDEPVGRILCITEDQQKGIWIGGDKGLYLLKEGVISKIELIPAASLAVEALYTDKEGNVWIGDLNAAYRISTADIKAAHSGTTGLGLKPFADFRKRVFSITADKTQNIYLASFDGVFSITKGTDQYKQVWENPDPVNFVRSVAALSPDSIYWNRNDAHPEALINGKLLTTYILDFLGRTLFLHHNKVYSLTTSGIATVGQDLEQVVSFGSTANNAVTSIIDAEENIWIGTWEGLLKFRKTSFQQYKPKHESHTEIFSFLEKKDGQLLFGGNRGIVFTKQNDEIVPGKNIPSLFRSAEVQCMYEDAENSLWAGSGYQGISRYKNKQVTNWSNTGFLKDNNCEAIFPLANNKLAACTENGVTIIDPLTTEPLQAHYAFQKKYTRYPELFGCFQQAASSIWFYGSQGLFRLQDTLLVQDSISGMAIKGLYINKIISDKKNNIWIATHGKGLLLCYYKNGKLNLLKQYNSSNGLSSDIALSVLVDKNGNIWCGDHMSLSVLLHPGAAEHWVTYNEKDDLLSSYYQTLKLEQQKDGTIWGLTSMGVISFHPDSINLNNNEPILMLDNISPHGINKNFAGISSPSFSYKNNSVQIRFTAVSLTNPSKIRYAYRIKELDTSWTYTSNRVVDLNFLKAGHYTFELRACNNSNVWTTEVLQYKFSIRSPWWQTWWFRLIALLVIIGILFFLFRQRITTVKNKAAVRQQLTELEGKALRAQMNPHFIFNSLNAIQELIVTKNVDEGYQYLSNFSKLLRMVLHNSEKNSIPLSAEIEMIRLQLSLESLRFKNAFNYSIHIDDNIEPEMINIPPLLLQPYVENAVWHGLRHKEGEKNLWIRIKEIDHQLDIEIEDNGVGREKAGEIRKQKLGAEQFQSKGSSLSEQRINIINDQYPATATVKITDIEDGDGRSTGTKVKIILPVNLK